MFKNVSTNIQMPEPLWKAVKIRAAEEGKSMKQVIIEGLSILLSQKSIQEGKKGRLQSLLLKYSATSDFGGISDGSTEHDKYLYEKP